MQDLLTTVFPRQGHYAMNPANIAAYAPADLSVERIGDMIDLNAWQGNAFGAGMFERWRASAA